MPIPRRRGQRFIPLIGVAVVSLVAATASAPAQAAPTPSDVPSARAASDRLAQSAAPSPHSDITLITGDTVHVTVSAHGRYQTRMDLAPRPDGRKVTVTTLVGGGHTYVLPSDTADLVASGRVDRALFDVERLIADGYADDRTGSLPVIVQYPGQPAAHSARTEPGLRARADALPASTPLRTLESINAVALSVGKDSAATFWSSLNPARTQARVGTLGAGLSRVWLDRPVHASLDESVPMIGAPQAWAAGYDGTGVHVAILDTGIDATHPDLAGKVVASRSFVPNVPTVRDGHGHGTHVASTVVGSGAASDGRYRGVAPGADLIIGKVLDDGGSGNESWIIDAMEWATQTEHARIVSMSLGSGQPGDGTDPMSQAVDDLTASTDALFVIAAGNEGKNGARTVSSPGAANAALTVAAVSKSDTLADFSSHGPRITNYGLKPDIAAPGVDITAARASEGTDMGGGAVPVDQYYDTASGTSMATPHVAGSAAILLQEHPDWTSAQLKAALTSTGKDDGYTVYQQGAGRLDVGAAVRATVLAETEKVDFGRVRYPQTGPPITKPVAYRNDTDQPVTLNLATTVRTVSGAATPDGMFGVSPASLDVPAHGTAEAAVTLDPTLGTAGLYSGAVLATSEGVSLRIPIGTYKEPEGYELSVSAVPPDDASVSLLGPVIVRRVDTDSHQWTILPASGAVSVHLDKGVYSVTQNMAWKDRPGDFDNDTLLANPQVDLSQDTSITLDANTAQKIDFDLDRPTEIYGSTMSAWQIPAGSSTPYGVVTDQLPYLVQAWATPTGKATVGKFVFEHNHVLGTPQITAEIPRRGEQPALVLHPRYQHYSVLIRKLDGRMRLPVVDVGTGSATEFATADVRGKIALIDIGDQALTPINGLPFPFEALTRAAGAGAAAVFAYGNAGMPVMDVVWGVRGNYPLPTVALSAEEGAALRDRADAGPVSLRIDSEPTVPDIYDLFYTEQGAIPASLHRRISDRALATVQPTYHASTPIAVTENWSVSRSSVYPQDSSAASHTGVTLFDTPGPTTRTEHLGPVSGDAVWSRIVSSDDLATLFRYGEHVAASARNLVTTVAMYDQPGFYREDFNQAPVVPGMAVPSPEVAQQLKPTDSGPTCAVCRYSGVWPGGDMLLLMTSAMDGDGHFGPPTSFSNKSPFPTHPVDEWHLYSGDSELPQFGLLSSGVLPFYVLPQGQAADYRLTEHYVDEFPVDGYGTHADTTWTFHSTAPTGKDIPDGYDSFGVCLHTCEVEPLLFLSYQFNLQIDNTLPAPGVHAFTVTAYHQPSESVMPKVAGLSMQASVDGGKHWDPVLTLPLGGGRYQVFLLHRQLTGDTGTVSLRTEAWDTAGNRINQTLTDAYGLASHHWWPRQAR